MGATTLDRPIETVEVIEITPITPAAPESTPESAPTLSPLQRMAKVLREAEAKGVRQIYGSWVERSPFYDTVGYCAMGILAHEAGLSDFDIESNGDGANAYVAEQYSKSTYAGGLWASIMRRNDDWKWSFGQIADWLEQSVADEKFFS